ncbi:MAG: hypothetical protein HON90_14225 [Halobacteriovoraceae bacterium]|nr:hypothetical protein [Halobacteriovoraceae bacterium]
MSAVQLCPSLPTQIREKLSHNLTIFSKAIFIRPFFTVAGPRGRTVASFFAKTTNPNPREPFLLISTIFHIGSFFESLAHRGRTVAPFFMLKKISASKIKTFFLKLPGTFSSTYFVAKTAIGGRSELLDELCNAEPYVPIIITHFFNKPIQNWWATLEGYEKIVLQFSHEAREFFPELLDTWEAPKAKDSKQSEVA